VIRRAAVADAMAARDGRPLVLLDLAVPRDVEPETAYVEGARVIDIVSLRERLAEHDAETAGDITTAHQIVADEVHRYVVRRRGDELAPLIRALRRRGEDIVNAEMGRFASRLSDLTPDEREAVDALARGITAKLLHDPIVALKERSGPGLDAVHARVLADLLGIDDVDAGEAVGDAGDGP
jgi:glutamyl-tRNA reductase